MAKLITNQKEFLTEIIEKILPTSQNLCFLVGYFYFSGFEQIYRNLGNRKLRILVGMNIERDLSNKIKEFHIVEELNQSRLEIRKGYYTSFVDIFNDSDFFDCEERQNAFRIFIEKIKNGTLEIKKTEYPNHAKLYLFEHKEDLSQGGLNPGTMITGSSNLTISGLKNRHEVNVILREDYGEGKKLFDDLWDNHSVDIVREGDISDFTREVIDKIWLDKLYSPFLFYIRVLIEYFDLQKEEEVTFPDEITEGRFFNLKYQKDAILKALHIIEQHNGVLVCDVVGLGKSIIASAAAYNLRKKVIIIAPPHLHHQWDKEYRTIFNLNAVCLGSDSIDKALDHLQNVWNNEEILVIVDEAHKYRSENTDSYVLLHRLCQGNKVILLTATPFNNRPQDIFSMIKLFQIPSKSTIRTVANLSLQFQLMIQEYKNINKERRLKAEVSLRLQERIKSLGSQIRHTLEPVIIRRSRIDIDKIREYREDLKMQKVKYIFAEPPIEKEYYLGELSNLYIETLNRINPPDAGEQTSYIGARYKPANYLRDRDAFKEKLKKDHPHIDPQALQVAQSNLANFMRRLLVARFESSVYAFQKSLGYMLHSMKLIKDYHDKLGKVPVFKKGYLPDVETLTQDLDLSLQEDLSNYTFDEELQAQYEKGLFFIPATDLRNDFIDDLNKDINLLTDIYNQWFTEGITKDPKLDSFIEEIKQQLANDSNRKIVVFSEYADTAKYIYDTINKSTDIKVLYYSSSVSTSNIRTIVRENFDASSPVRKNDYDIIIATDALSEGVNLNRAGTVFNYDIPYNPTRVIQRVGRINRIGKMLFDKIYIYNYFPTDIGEKEIRRKQISTFKKAMIDAIIGEDTKVLTKYEELNSYFYEKYLQAIAEQEEESWDTQYREHLNQLKQSYPEIIKQAAGMPHRSRIRRTIPKVFRPSWSVSLPYSDHLGTERNTQPNSDKLNNANQSKDALSTLNVSGPSGSDQECPKSIPALGSSSIVIFGKKGTDFAFSLGLSADASRSISAEEAFSLFKAEISEKPHPISSSFENIYQNAKVNMFITKTQTSNKGAKGEAINKIEYLKDNYPEKKDYFTDLYYVAKELNSLPDKVYYFIRNIGETTLDEDINQLQNIVPHNYLERIIKTANKIDEGKETLILAEEFSNE